MAGYYTEERTKRYQEMLANYDLDGIRQLKFGKVIFDLRQLRKTYSSEFSQGDAAKIAKITRPQWNRIENGLVLPRPSTIPKIANALHIAPIILFKLAGYVVPDEYMLYDTKSAHERLDDALKECNTLTEFFLYMEIVWQECRAQEMEPIKFKLPDRISVRPVYAELVAAFLEYSTHQERMMLAKELVESAPHHVAESLIVDMRGFYDMVGFQLDLFRQNDRYSYVSGPGEDLIFKSRESNNIADVRLVSTMEEIT